MGILMKVLFVAVIAITIIAFVWKEATRVLPAKVVTCKSCYLHKSRRCVVNYYSWYFVILTVIWASGIYLMRF